MSLIKILHMNIKSYFHDIFKIILGHPKSHPHEQAGILDKSKSLGISDRNVSLGMPIGENSMSNIHFCMLLNSELATYLPLLTFIYLSLVTHRNLWENTLHTSLISIV